MFYVCDKKDDKFGVKDTSDSVVEYYTEEELSKIRKDYGIRIFGSLKGGSYRVLDVDEFQTLDWERCIIFSFVDKINNRIYLGVETRDTGKSLYARSTDCYLSHNGGSISYSSPKNGQLQWIFNEGKVNKCAGICIWLEYGFEGEKKSYLICIEAYLELYPDNKIHEVEFSGWDFNESGYEFSYDEETDSIV